MFTNHIGIKVKNIEEAQKFYCENLGFSLDHIHDDDKRTLVFLKNENSEIELVYPKGVEFDSTSNGIVEHIAFTVDSVKEYEKKLKLKGVKILSEDVMELDGKKIIFFEGPSGEKLELVEYI